MNMLSKPVQAVWTWYSGENGYILRKFRLIYILSAVGLSKRSGFDLHGACLYNLDFADPQFHPIGGRLCASHAHRAGNLTLPPLS